MSRFQRFGRSAGVVVTVLALTAASGAAYANNRPDNAGKPATPGQGAGQSSVTTTDTDAAPGNSGNAQGNRPADPGNTPADRTPGATPDTRPSDTRPTDTNPGQSGSSAAGSGASNSGGNNSSSSNSSSPTSTESGKGNSSSAPGKVNSSNAQSASTHNQSGKAATAKVAVNPVAAANSAARALASVGSIDETETDLELAQRSALLACLSDALGKENRASSKSKKGAASAKALTASKVKQTEQECEEEIGTKGRYLVKFTPGSNASEVAKSAREKSAIRAENKFAVERVFTDVFPGMAITAGSAQITALKKNPNVEVIEPDGFALTTATQSPAPWGLDRIDQRSLPLTTSYTYESTGGGTTVYVIDTGVRADHVDFTGRVASGYTAIADGRGTEDCNGHGTHVAGTSAGATYGVAKAAAIVPVRVLDCYGSGTWSGVIAGLDWVARNHSAGAPAVANMSLGGGANSLVDDAVRAVIADGVTTVVAAGNSATDACTASPARVREAITVAASDSSDVQASFTNVGSCVDLYAPGVGIASDWYTSSTATATLSGTSMASPHVAGAAALLAPTNPGTAWSALQSSATSGAITSVTGGTPNLLLFVGSTTTEPPAPEPPTDPEATVPDAPGAPSAVGGSRSATVTWTIPADGGSAITHQTVWIYNSRGRLAGTVNVSATESSVTVTGLAPRKTYTFAVSAANVVGSGAQSARSAPVTTTR